MDLTKEYWANRYVKEETGWDLGEASVPITHYADQLKSKTLKILIPGCGNAHEAEYLFNKGFENVHILDIAKEPLDRFKSQVPDFPSDQLICENFFQHHGTYDLVIEQTFFCALDPKLRQNYAEKMSELLNERGKLVGLLFNVELNENEPPFGGSKEEYFEYFRPYFEFQVFETCHNSIKPRAGRELFIILQKK